MTRAILPGSFDPITNGHLDILKRALGLFDQVVIVIAGASQKNPLLNPEERVALIQDVVRDEFAAKDAARVTVDRTSGLIMDYARDHSAKAVIRGLRAASDFEYEFMMASMNRNINPDVETLFMMTSQNLFFVSSTMIKELFLYGGDISPYVPARVVEVLKKKNPKRESPKGEKR